MRRVLHKPCFATLLGLTVAPFAAAQCPTNYAQVTANAIGAIKPLASGRMVVIAHDSSGNPINYGVFGVGVELTRPRLAPVVNGAIVGQLCLPRTDAITTPVAYHFIVTDTSAGSSNAVVLDADNVAITSPIFNLDAYTYPINAGPFQLNDLAIVQVGTVTPLAPDANPTVTVTGTLGAAILNFGFPQVTHSTDLVVNSVTAPTVTTTLVITPSNTSDKVSAQCWGSADGAGLSTACGMYDSTFRHMVWSTNTTGDFFIGSSLVNGQVAAGGDAPWKFVRTDPGDTAHSIFYTPGNIHALGTISGSLKGIYSFPTSNTSDSFVNNCYGSSDNLGLSGGCGMYDNTSGTFPYFVNKTGDIWFGVPLSGGNVSGGTGSPFGILHNGTFAGSAFNNLAIGNATSLAGISANQYTNTAMPALAYWYAALHNCRNQVVRIGLYADSRGVVDSVVNSQFTATMEGRYAERLRTKLQAACGSHGTGVLPVNITYINPAQAFVNNDYYSLSGSFSASDTTIGPAENGDSQVVQAVSNGATVSFSPSRMLDASGASIGWDHLSVTCVSGPGFNPWTMQVDGATVGTCGGSSASAETAVKGVSSAVALGPHAASLICSKSPCSVYSMEGVAGTTGVSVDNYSVGGASLEVQASSPSQWAFADLNPAQLMIMAHGTNESGLGIPASTFQASLNNFITHARGLPYPASVLFFIPAQDYDNQAAAQSTYYPLVASTAASQSVAFADLRNRWGQASGPSFLFGPDGIHENDVGNGEAFSSIWTTVVDVLPACANSACN